MIPLSLFRTSRFFGFLLAALTILLTSLSVQAAPAAPTGLRGAVTSGTALTLIWNDNSTDETHFELAWTDNAVAQTALAVSVASAGNGSTPGTGTVFVGLSPLTAGHTYTFKIRAYTTTNANSSAYTNTITMVTNDFATPNIVDAFLQTDGSVLVRWVDNAITEAGYFLEYRALPSGTFAVAGSTGQNFTGYTIGGLAPSTSYEFRVRGFKGTASSPTSTTSYTSVATATTPATLLAPTGLSVTATNETSLSLAFTDNTALNTGYEIEYGLSGSGTFIYFGEAGDGAAITANNSVAPGTAYAFRIRAYYQNGTNPRVYSAYSNTASVTTPFTAPTALTATATSETQINLSWTNNSSAQQGVGVYVRSTGSGSYTLLNYAGAAATSYSVTGLSPGTSYDFQVKAAYQRTAPGTSTIVESAASNTQTVGTKDGFTSRGYQPITYNQAFSYQAVVSTSSARNSWNITSLPTGLTFNSSTGIVSGTPTVTGVFSCPMTATFASGWTTNTTLSLRIIRAPGAPVATTTISGQTLAKNGSTSIYLGDKFSDPDAESAVRLITNVGTMDFILYNTATPQTVTNFLSYVNAASNNFNGAIFHRSAPGFIVQGGAFKVKSTDNTFTATPTSASPVNEPGISNLRGTVAMAKVGSDPNSATDQFFVNLADNSANLDNQNGGFTAFARVAGNGMTTADAINALPRVQTGATIDGVANPLLTDWPLTSSSSFVDPTKVVSITSAAPVAVLSYSVTGNTNPTAVTASISGGTNLQISGPAGGQSNITVTATDLDGNTVSQSFAVAVSEAPLFTSSAPTTPSLANQSYSFTCSASGYPAPTFSVTAGALPTGLSISSGGAITGTSTATGVFTGTITASNGIGTAATQNFSITINQAPAFTSAAPTSSSLLNTAYSFTCTASGYPAPTFSVPANTLPTGLSLNPTSGAITGTPTATGVFTGTITASNGIVTAATQNFSITINQAPAFTSAAPTSTGSAGTAYNFTCSASGYPVPTFSRTAGALPTGLTLSNAGIISGTPSAAGTFTGTITASNGIGTAATQNFSITINATLSNWASGYNLSGSDALPSADPDHDGHTNLEEFAFMTDPTIANTTAVPSYVLAAPGATKFGEITFPVRKLAPSLTYTVEASTDLVSGSWTTLWTSANGFSASVVSLAVDQSDRTVLTVRDTQASPPATRRFLRVKISQP